MSHFFTLIGKALADAQNTEFGPASNVGDYVNKLIPAIIGILGSVALLVMIIAGYIYMTSQGDQSKITLAKELIIGAITGILLLFLIGILKNQIGF